MVRTYKVEFLVELTVKAESIEEACSVGRWRIEKGTGMDGVTIEKRAAHTANEKGE